LATDPMLAADAPIIDQTGRYVTAAPLGNIYWIR
jgi:hypothetical protein